MKVVTGMSLKPAPYSLRALAFLLSYPDEGRRQHWAELPAVFAEEGALSASRREELNNLVNHLIALDPLAAQALYVETFDRGRATCLNLFEHVHGDSRDRGAAMVNLGETYAAAQFDLVSEELPDHLCVLLEFASLQEPAAARDFLAELAHIVNLIFTALQAGGNPYAAVLAAVLDLAGEKAEPVALLPEVPLDESWQEPLAFAGCATPGQGVPGGQVGEQVVHLVPAGVSGRAAAANLPRRQGVNV